MIRSKLGLMTLCTMVVGVIAVSASSAQAALSWLYLEGGVAKGVMGTEKLPIEGKRDTEGTDLALLSKELGIKFAITCNKFNLVGANLEKEGEITEGFKIKVEECEAYGKGLLEEPLGCKVHSSGQPIGTVISAELKGQLVLHEISGGGGAKELLVRIEPKEGTILGTFLTEKCSLPEVNPVHGVIYVKDCKGEAIAHLREHLVAQGSLTLLWVGADNAEHLETGVDGSVFVFLGPTHANQLWGGMDA